MIKRELIYFWYYFSIQFEQIFRYWLLGMIIGSLVSVFAKEKIHSLFKALQGKKLGLLGIIPAALLGIASPLCMYGTIPIAASFNEQGMREDWLAAFMMCSILLNPQLMFYSAALGPVALAIRFILCLICGIVAGLLIKFCFKNKSFFNFSNFNTSPDQSLDCPKRIQNHGEHGEPLVNEIKNLNTKSNSSSVYSVVKLLLKNFARNVKATGLYFLAGVALSALFQRFVPPHGFARLFGNSSGFGILMAATVGVPLYVCGGGTIPLIQSWLQSGMSLGAASSFMIAGPAMKITNLGALKIVLGIKHFLFYLLFAVIFAFLSGLVIDLLI